MAHHAGQTSTRFRLTLLWARTGYRPWARLLHRLSLHHTRRIGPLEPDGVFIHRCEWCGVSRTEVPLEVTLRRMKADRSSERRTNTPASTALSKEERST